MKKSFKIGKMLKHIDQNGKESFLTPEMHRGSITLYNQNGSIADTRTLQERDGKQSFTYFGTTYERKAI